MSISNDPYGNNVMSAYEIVKTLTRNKRNIHNNVSQDKFDSQEILTPKRKLALLFRSKIVSEITICVRGMI